MTYIVRWLPGPLQERAAWMQNFAERFATVAVPLGFTAADVTAVEDDNEAFQFVAEGTVEIDAYAKAFRGYRDNLLDGEIGGRPPMFPANPTAVPPNAVGSGLYERLDELVKRIKVSPAYTPEVGELLGIVAPSTVRPAPEDMQPVLKVQSLPGSVLNVKFVRGQTDGVVLETKVDNSDTWTHAGRYVYSPAELVIPENPSGQPRAVQVRARYMERNDPVGQFSAIVSAYTQPAD